MSHVTPPPRPATEDLHVLPLGVVGNKTGLSGRKFAVYGIVYQS